jgi:hypothetical protein
MPDETLPPLMQWFIDNPPKPPPCDECEVRAYVRFQPRNVLHVRRDHLPGCSRERGVEIVTIAPGGDTSTLG